MLVDNLADVEIDGRRFMLRPIPPELQQRCLDCPNVVAFALAVAFGKNHVEWGVGFFFGNPELSCELWNVIAGISGMDND